MCTLLKIEKKRIIISIKRRSIASKSNCQQELGIIGNHHPKSQIRTAKKGLTFNGPRYLSLISAERCKKIVWNLNLWFHVWTSTFHQSGLSIGARPNSLSVRLQTQVLSHISPKVEDVTSNKNVHVNETCTFLFVAILYEWKDGKFVNYVDHFWFRL